MNFKRIGRMAICLLLVFVLLFNIVSIEAKATGLVEGLIAGASAINVPAAIAICATLIALGVMGKAADTSGTNMNNLVNQAQAHLDSVGGWIQDGTIEMIRTVDETGYAMYYAGVDLFETLRGWLFDDEVVTPAVRSFDAGFTYTFFNGDSVSGVSDFKVLRFTRVTGVTTYYYEVAFSSTGSFTDSSSSSTGSVPVNNVTYWYAYEYTSTIANYTSNWNGSLFLGNSNSATSSLIATAIGYYLDGSYDSKVRSDEFEIGTVSTVPIDGTSAKEWASEYAEKGLYVLPGGGSGMEPDDGAEGNDNWKWMLPVGLTALIDLLIMTQAEQWIAETDEDFSDYTTSEEYVVTPQPEIDGYPAIELTPVTDPDTGGESGGNTGTDVDTDYTTWFQKVVDWLEGIWEAITNIPDAIVNGIKTVLQDLFVPDPDFILNKVEALQAQYSFLEPMKQTGEDLKLFFQNIGSQPPIIWIDLGAGTGWYPMGGKVKFIDLTWYSQYKSTADFIVGGSIWLWLAWRMFKAIPGIISGDSGSVGTPVVAPDISFNTARFPVGRSRRKKDGE